MTASLTIRRGLDNIRSIFLNNLKMIKNAQVVTENGIIWDGVIIIFDGKIVQVGK